MRERERGTRERGERGERGRERENGERMERGSAVIGCGTVAVGGCRGWKDRGLVFMCFLLLLWDCGGPWIP